jgi:polysaccharide export outer membrane protein
MSSFRILTVLALVAASACKSGDDKAPLLTGGASGAPAPKQVSPEIEHWFRTTVAAAGVRIVPGDRVSIDVQDHDALRIVRDVPPNGEIPVYRTNKSVTIVKALGRTPQELEALVAAVHAADLENPYVTVHIDEAAPRSIYVVGGVKSPGVYAVSGNGRLTVLQALALAGGTSERSDLASITIQRIHPPTGETVSSPALDIRRVIEEHDQRDNLVVEPGDTIVVPERQDLTVQVLGHVSKPGSFEWRKGERLSEALADAGSFAKFAKKSAIRVVRNGRENIVVNYEDVLEGRAPDLELQPGDVIFVDEKWM